MSENEIKPVAWRFKDYLPVLADGYAYGYTHDPQSPVADEPLYDQAAIDRLTAERDVALGKLAAAYAETDAHWKVLLKAKGELAEARAERDAAAEAFTRLFLERKP